MASAFYSQPQQRSWPLAGAAQQHAARPPPIRQASGPGPGPAGGGVTSWLSGWTKLAEEQGCAVSALEVEGSYTQQLLQRASGGLGSQHLSRGCSCTMPSPTCCADARMLASVAVGPSQSHQQLLSQRHLGLSAFQEQQAPSAARAAASVLSDGSSNTNSSGSRCGGAPRLPALCRALCSVPCGVLPAPCTLPSANPCCAPCPRRPCSCTVGRGSNELKQRLNPFAYAQGPAGGTGTHARRPPARLSPLRQQQQEQAQQRVPPRGYTSMDVGRPAATAPAQGRTSIDCWADGSSMASAHQQGGSRGAKRKSEDCFAPPARHQATVGGWQTALSSAFYTPSAPLPPVQSATLPGPE